MFKRLFCAILAVTLSLSCTCAALAQANNASEPELFEFWDIPFGCSQEEFIQAAYEKTGFVFAPGKPEDKNFWTLWGVDKNDITLVVDVGKQSISLLGCALHNAIAIFNGSTGKFYSLHLTVVRDRFNKSKTRDALYSGLSAKYGLPTDGWFSVRTDADGDLRYDLPIKDGKLDQDVFEQVDAVEDSWITLTLDWKNIRFFADGFYSQRLLISDTLPKPFRSVDSLGYYSDVVAKPMEYQNSDAGL